MSTRIGLVSDTHASPAPLKEALAIFKVEGVETVLCPGDIGGYGDRLEETVQLLMDSDCQAILGNHEIWQLGETGACDESPALNYFRSLPRMLDLDLEGKQLHMAHASPPQSVTEGIRLLDEHGEMIPEQKQSWTERLAQFDYDVLVVGHTHQVFAEPLGRMLVINPGSATYNHTCAILSFPDMAVQWFSLSGKAPTKVWNWGDQVRAGPVD